MRSRTISLVRNFRADRIPRKPGVYFFLGRNKKVLYIGKAADLRVRLRTYFGSDAPGKTKRLVQESVALRFQPADSEITALLEEARHIKRVQPRYNVLWRDDKNYFFVGITKEKLPRIFITHQPKKTARARFLGPFVSGRSLKNTLKLIRQSFPFCTCKTPHARTCLQAQLGLCPGFCCTAGVLTSRSEDAHYKRAIRTIMCILAGRGAALRNALKKEIEQAARRAEFEHAHELNITLRNLEKVFAHRGIIESFWIGTKARARGNPIETLEKILGIESLKRIEMYDASAISGKSAVGAMIVFEGKNPQKAEWRLFRIYQAAPDNDPAMIGELIRRRFAHPEWGYPDLICVDGGIGQFSRARKELQKRGIAIPVAALAKGTDRTREYLLFGAPPKTIDFAKLPRETALFLRRIQGEAHRFAISYHRKTRRRALFE